MIEKWVNFKRDYLEISFLREKWVCAISPYERRDDKILLLGSITTIKMHFHDRDLSFCFYETEFCHR